MPSNIYSRTPSPTQTASFPYKLTWRAFGSILHNRDRHSCQCWCKRASPLPSLCCPIHSRVLGTEAVIVSLVWLWSVASVADAKTTASPVACDGVDKNSGRVDALGHSFLIRLKVICSVLLEEVRIWNVSNQWYWRVHVFETERPSLAVAHSARGGSVDLEVNVTLARVLDSALQVFPSPDADVGSFQSSPPFATAVTSTSYDGNFRLLPSPVKYPGSSCCLDEDGMSLIHTII